MTLDDLRDEVIDTITYELACMGGFSMDDTLKTLGADDLDVIKLMVAIEHRFKVEIEDAAFGASDTVNAVLSLVAAKLGV